jgi:hypothetical protein
MAKDERRRRETLHTYFCDAVLAHPSVNTLVQEMRGRRSGNKEERERGRRKKKVRE